MRTPRNIAKIPHEKLFYGNEILEHEKLSAYPRNSKRFGHSMLTGGAKANPAIGFGRSRSDVASQR